MAITATAIISNVTLAAAGGDQTNISKLALQAGTTRLALDVLLTSSVAEAEEPSPVDVYYVNTQQNLTANAATAAQLYLMAKKITVRVPLAAGPVSAKVPSNFIDGGFLYSWVNHPAKSGTALLTVTAIEV